MEEANVKQRLEETVSKCVECYEAWSQDNKKAEVRQQLEDAVHELRKVTSRIEIELAISDRSNSSMKPMPIPPHRASNSKSASRRRNNNNKGGNGNNSDQAAQGDKPARSGGAKRTKLKTITPKDAAPKEQAGE